MCLAEPGRIVAIAPAEPMGGLRDVPPADATLWRMATVDFGGVRQSVSLACLPEACLGDLVLVHVGLAICRVEESLLELMEEPIAPAAPPDPVRQPSPTPRTVPFGADRLEGQP
jgi:hydrogenase expression/formation protein HypC